MRFTAWFTPYSIERERRTTRRAAAQENHKNTPSPEECSIRPVYIMYGWCKQVDAIRIHARFCKPFSQTGDSVSKVGELDHYRRQTHRG